MKKRIRINIKNLFVLIGLNSILIRSKNILIYKIFKPFIFSYNLLQL